MKFENWLNEDKYIELLTNFELSDYFKVHEAFNKSVDFKINKKDNEFFSTTFNINNIEYIFLAKIVNETALILFYPLDEEIESMFKQRKESKVFLGSLFSTIFDSIKELLKEHEEIRYIEFNTENEKLKSIYEKLSKIFIKRFSDWEFYSKDNFQNKLIFRFIRK